MRKLWSDAVRRVREEWEALPPWVRTTFTVARIVWTLGRVAVVVAGWLQQFCG